MTGVSYLEVLRLTAPEIVVALSGFLAITLDLTLLRRATIPSRTRSGILTGCAGCVIAILLIALTHPQGSLPGSMLVVDPLTNLIQIALLVLTILTLALAASARFTSHVGEYPGLILFATAAIMILVSTQNLLLIFLTIEFLSLSLYILTGFDKSSKQSAEAALKYFLFGGMSASFLLFGMSLLYGISGSLELKEIAMAATGPALDPTLIVAIVMVVTGLGFKIAAAPFHLWAPDVYQGAPTWSAGFIASSSKVASFFILAQILYFGLSGASGNAAYRSYAVGWAPLIAVVAVVSMVWGNLAAIAQTSMRRLLAYSAVGHAGYMLIALAAHSERSFIALVYYVITYALAALGAFGVLAALEGAGVDTLSDFSGMSRRAPGISFCLLIFLLSLAGIPPLAGFFGKFYVFVAALEMPDRFGLLWLVLLGIAMSTVSLYYYLKVLKRVYVSEPQEGTGEIQASVATRVVLWVIAALVVILGCAPDLLLSRVSAALALLR